MCQAEVFKIRLPLKSSLFLVVRSITIMKDISLKNSQNFPGKLASSIHLWKVLPGIVCCIHGCSRHTVGFYSIHYCSYASFRIFMSILFILSIAIITLFTFSGSLSCNSLPKTEGMICHDNPYLSLSHPQRSSDPPAESFLHNSSTYSCVSQFTKSDIAGVNVNCGPPFKAIKICPSS